MKREIGDKMRESLTESQEELGLVEQPTPDAWGVWSWMDGEFYFCTPHTYENAVKEATLCDEELNGRHLHTPVTTTQGMLMKNATAWARQKYENRENLYERFASRGI